MTRGEVMFVELSVVGRPVPRLDAVAKVTGRAAFVTDLDVPRMAHAAIHRSPHAHARILGVDVRPAVALPGVLAVLTAEDCPGRFGPILRDRPLLAAEEVRYAGEPVAAVVALDPETAAEAVQRIEVRYQALPAALDVATALAPGAPRVHSSVDLAPDAYFPPGGIDLEHNVCTRARIVRGDPEAAFDRAALVVEGRYTFPAVYHYALEPHCAVAWADADGVTVHSSCQHPYQVRQDIADLFGLPLAHVRIVSGVVGGGFGSKSFSHVEPLAVALALRAGVPVRLALSVEEAALTTRRHAAEAHLRTAVDGEGRLLAHVAEIRLDGGAYAQTGPLVAQKAAWRSLGAYRLPNYRVESLCVYTHTSPAGSFRAIGGPQAAWALESHMQEVADRLGMDGVTFRRLNLAVRGERFRPGRRRLDADTGRLLAAVADRPGVAVTACDPGARALSTATVRLLADGSAVVHAGTVEIGQGTRTVMAQIAAEVLSLPLERVRVPIQDSDSTPYDTSTGASRSTAMMGTAVARAAQDALTQLAEASAERLGCRPEELQFAAGRATWNGRSHTYAELMRLCFRARGGEIVGHGAALDHEFDEEPFFWEVAAAGADVRLDAETGQLSVERYVAAADVGRAINPLALDGQEQGAAVQGLGHTLFEAMRWRDGQLVNGSLLDYRVPCFGDVPDDFTGHLVEDGDGPGPFGAKGAGEGAIVPVAPAIANALKARAGVRAHALPLTPEAVWRLLRERQA